MRATEMSGITDEQQRELRRLASSGREADLETFERLANRYLNAGAKFKYRVPKKN